MRHRCEVGKRRVVVFSISIRNQIPHGVVAVEHWVPVRVRDRFDATFEVFLERHTLA